jgi:hypothetical protein
MGVKIGLSHQREEHILKAFEKRALRGIFGSKRGVVAGF